MLKTQTFLKYLKYLPPFLRRKYLRAIFEVQSEFPSEFLFKKAESQQEIQDALQLMQTFGSHNVNLNAFFDHPNTTFFIAKWKEKVVGSLCVVKDGILGVPSQTTSAINKMRSQGKNLAEVSPLCLKKDFSLHREKVLLALCKTVYLYCTQILKVDTIIASTLPGTEYFYTDILLFQKLREGNSEENFLGFLPVNQDLHIRYLEVYGDQPKNKNLLHFLAEMETKCIQLPCQKSQLLRRSKPRVEIQNSAMAFVNGSKIPQACSVLNVSDNGLQIKLEQAHSQVLLGQPILVVFEHNQEWITCQATIKWLESQKRLGCAVNEKSHSWKKFTNKAWSENSTFKKAA